ncbi:hypothetical protein PQD71_gp162 [Kosakonia phage Kc263]|uniref:Uncharacterized protein n=1 Tax=Kosakonia phage Kc263 TaxID=2863194 RepID=A0AAE7WFR8_9CAUD|nr:hypothetical protein PQD71_gp162 [Kosakonia phage Kc263]QYN80055.1 hypothetical protein [Kosakonia phage Kc263]
MDDNIRYVDETNIDAFYFELTGETHRGRLWQIWQRLRIKIRNRKYNRRIKIKEVRNFFHKDLQQLRYHGGDWKPEIVRVRYTDQHGDLCSRRFLIKKEYGSVLLLEVKGDTPLRVNGTKGPRTLKRGYWISNRYYWLGLRKTKIWSIPYGNML